MSNAVSILTNANASGGGNYLEDGSYLLAIGKVFVKNADGHECFIVETKVLESEQDPKHPEVRPNPVGSDASYVQILTKFKSAPGNAKAFLQGALEGLGYTPDKITDKVIADAVSAKNPMRGLVVRAKSFRKTIKSGANEGKPITLFRWEGVPQTREEIAKMREKLAAWSKQETSAAASGGVQVTAQVAPPPPQPSTPGLADLGLDI